MRTRKELMFGAILMILLVSALPIFSQVKSKGEISGIVVDQEDVGLPGVTVTLVGERLFLKSLSTVTNERGLFRFLNLIPGDYSVEISLSGFDTLRLTSLQVSVGKATPVTAKLMAAKLNQEVTIVAQAPLIETKTTQISTNYSREMVQNVPTSRDIKDLINATAGINDNVAYGADGRVNNAFAEGSMTGGYRLNGVDVGGVDYAYTFITPIYETIEEFQVVGIGATAEYGNFSGATANVTTKSGTNEFHGGVNANYTSDKFRGDNSGGIIELKAGRVDYDFEGTFHLGGPIIREKLFFFAAGGYVSKKWEEYFDSPLLTDWTRPNFYGKLDFVINNKNTITAMVTGNPLTWKNNYLVPGSPKTIGADEFLNMTTWYGSWQSIFTDHTYFDLRYAGYRNKWSRYPITRGVPQYRDNDTYKRYGGFTYDFDFWEERHESNAAMTHYADDFLSSSHEFKLGFEYEHARKWDRLQRPGVLTSLTIGNRVRWQAQVGGDSFANKWITRVGGFAQDNIKIGTKINVNIGIRLDNPKLKAKDFGDVFSFNVFSPRFGFSYDFGGDAKNVLHLSYGRYYDKMMTGTYTQCVPGGTDTLVYRTYLDPAPFDPTNANIIAKMKEITQPQNLYGVYTSGTALPIDSNFKVPFTDTYSIGFEKQLFKNYALEVDYLYRKMHNLAQIATRTKHTYEALQWTDPWLGKTVTIWQQVDNLPEDLYLGNSSWSKYRTHMFLVTLRKRMTDNWSMISSFTYQDTKGNVKPGGFLFGYPDFNVDNDPMYTQNPWIYGEPWMTHKYVFKTMGTYLLPAGFIVSGNLRVLSGISWNTEVGGYYADLYRSYGGVNIILEPRGAHHIPATWNLDLRLAKAFKMGGGSSVELMLDVFNVFNNDYAFVVSTDPTELYYQSGKSSYGKPYFLASPRQARFGIRLTF